MTSHLVLPFLTPSSFSLQRISFLSSSLSSACITKVKNWEYTSVVNCRYWWWCLAKQSWYQVTMNDRKKLHWQKSRPFTCYVMFDSQWSTHIKCWLAKIYYYVKTIRVEKRKIYSWEKYFCIKQLQSCQSRLLKFYWQICWEKGYAAGDISYHRSP